VIKIDSALPKYAPTKKALSPVEETGRPHDDKDPMHLVNKPS
jgi:hypothetical protein